MHNWIFNNLGLEAKYEKVKVGKNDLPQIIQQENNIFEKLYNEKLNFCNSLKLILGKKIRIKAEKIK